jgi:hypothetical protein
MSLPDDAPYHAHIYFSPEQRGDAEALRGRFEAERDILFVGRMTEGKAGPHPIPQYEVHFLRKSVDRVQELIRASDFARWCTRSPTTISPITRAWGTGLAESLWIST